jgi:hypothetical protein
MHINHGESKENEEICCSEAGAKLEATKVRFPGFSLA